MAIEVTLFVECPESGGLRKLGGFRDISEQPDGEYEFTNKRLGVSDIKGLIVIERKEAEALPQKDSNG